LQAEPSRTLARVPRPAKLNEKPEIQRKKKQIATASFSAVGTLPTVPHLPWRLGSLEAFSDAESLQTAARQPRAREPLAPGAGGKIAVYSV